MDKLKCLIDELCKCGLDGRSIWGIIQKLPAFRFMLHPIDTIEELYEKYPAGSERGSTVFIYEKHAFYAWDFELKTWERIGGIQEINHQGKGNVVTDIKQNGNTITVEKGNTALIDVVVTGKGSVITDISRSEDGSKIIITKKELSEVNGSDEWLSRLYDDTAYGHITFDNGVLVKTGSGSQRISAALHEEGETKGLSAGLVEDENNKSLSSTPLIEQSSITMGGTIGTLENVDPAFDSLTNGDYVLNMRNGVFSPKPFSGAGGGSTMTLKSISGVNLSVLHGSSILIEYLFTSVDTSDQSQTGNGTAVCTVNGNKVSTQIIPQGEVSFDVGKFLSLGDNLVAVTVTDSYGKSRTLTYSITAVLLSISSNYDATGVNAGAATFRYTPVGKVEKTIYFVLDGTVISTLVTSKSGVQLTEIIPQKPHGVYRLEVYFTAEINGMMARSNTLSYELMFAQPGNNTPLIACLFDERTVMQYSYLSIPFTVYNSASAYTLAQLLVNGVLISELNADRRMQTWTYRAMETGELTMEIRAGGTSRVFRITVMENDEEGMILENLDLYLSASGRNNSETMREKWSFKDTAAVLKNFNFNTDGWIGENGMSSLIVVNGASVYIPFHLFGKDFRGTGKTIGFSFSTFEVKNFDTDIITCLADNIGIRISANEAIFRSEQSVISAKFKEEERVDVEFVVEPLSEHRLIYVFLNGIMAGVTQYPAFDNFQQVNITGITIGSVDCGIKLHHVRVYDNNLSSYQVLDNHISDMELPTTMADMRGFNNIYDQYGNISFHRAVQKIPCLIIEGELPAYKGDKKTCRMIYTDMENPSRSWEADKVSNDVQGTSSQYYPRKNFKAKFSDGFRMTHSGEKIAKFPVREGGIPENVFCFKADFAESSGTHNVGIALMADDALKRLGLLTPPQRTDMRVRNSIDGYPILIFHRNTESDEPEFVGKYNFNSEKANEDTYGFSGVAESWEFLNNTSDRSLFLSADFLGNEWKNDFEARYPDGNTNINNLRKVFEWVLSTKDDPEKFKAEVAQHFNINNLLFYWLFTELFGMVDQRAKNQFLTTWGNEGSGEYKWYFLFYDNDTCLGINNEGENVFGFGIESQDMIDGANVWNGARSLLWQQVEACFFEEMRTMYQTIRQQGILSYDKVMDYLNAHQSFKWSETVYNQDGIFKYIEPLTKEGNGSYLYALQGARREHRKWWIYNRFRYMDARFNAGDFLSDYITMRLYTPSDTLVIPTNPDFTLTAFQDQYVRVKYGSYIREARARKDAAVKIEAPDIVFNDTETIIYGASTLKDIGDLSGKYAGTIDVSKAVKLTRLLIGYRNITTYQNANLTSLAVGNNTLLELLDISGCVNLKGSLDLSGCTGLKELYASRSGVSSVSLARGGVLKTVYLPSVTSLILINQIDLSVVALDSWVKLTSLWIENCPKLPFMDYITQGNNALTRVRVTGVAHSLATDDKMFRGLLKKLGMDANGNNTSVAVMEGKIHFAKLSALSFLARYNAAWPDLQITYDQVLPGIEFSDANVKAICLANWDTDSNGYLSYAEAEEITDIGEKFRRYASGGIRIDRFYEFEFFTGLQEIPDNAFESQGYLYNITLPENIERIGARAFWQVGASINVAWEALPLYIPDGVKEIGEYAFNSCPKFLIMNIPPWLTAIENRVFYGTNVMTTSLPTGLTRIGEFAFHSAWTALPEPLDLVIPAGVKTIGQYAFGSNGKDKIRSITIGPNVTDIGTWAFANQKYLQELICQAITPPAIGSYILEYVWQNVKIYVPNERVAAYKAATNWNAYATNIYPLSDRPL